MCVLTRSLHAVYVLNTPHHRRRCYNAVISGKEILGTAQDVMKYCEKKLQVGKKVISETNEKYVTKREFIFINCGDVDRERPEVRTVQGTRKFHSVRSCG